MAIPYIAIALFVLVLLGFILLRNPNRKAVVRSRIKQVISRIRENPAETEEEPLQILKKRYVAGEITREEYLQVKKDLEIEEPDAD